MQKAIIHYFSGTGGTAHAVQKIKEALTGKDYEVQTVSISKGVKPPDERADLHIFAFCVLGFAPPVIFKNYIRKLKSGNQAKTSVIGVFGGHPFQAISQAVRMLSRRNYDVFLSYGFLFPNNWIQVSNMPDKNEAAKTIAEADSKIPAYMEKLTGGMPEHFKISRPNIIWTWIVSVLFGFIGRRFFGKTYIADKNCNACGICVKACPAQVIELQGKIRRKPHWNFSCENCNRCINICPQKSIQVSYLRLGLHGALNIIVTVFEIIALVKLYSYLSAQFILPIAVILEIAAVTGLTAVLFFLQFGVLDRVLFILEQIPGIDKIFEASYTRNFRRYTAPGFKPLAKE